MLNLFIYDFLGWESLLAVLTNTAFWVDRDNIHAWNAPRYVRHAETELSGFTDFVTNKWDILMFSYSGCSHAIVDNISLIESITEYLKGFTIQTSQVITKSSTTHRLWCRSTKRILFPGDRVSLWFSYPAGEAEIFSCFLI